MTVYFEGGFECGFEGSLEGGFEGYCIWKINSITISDVPGYAALKTAETFHKETNVFRLVFFII